MRALVVSFVCLAFVNVTEAGNAVVKSGGPKSSKQRKSISAALTQLSELGVCWRGKRPKKVSVRLSVGSDGRVRESSPVSKGASAQCAAGVLAVQSLPRTGKAYTATVELRTSVAGSSGDVYAELEKHRSRLDGCYDRSKAKKRGGSGDVRLRFLLAPSGAIRDASATSRLGDVALDACLVREIESVRLVARPRKPMMMTLDLHFSKSSKAGSAAAGSSLRPQKDGPLAAAAISAVMKKRKADFSRCYDRVARKKPSLAGRVVLRFSVRGNGTVRNVKVRETSLKNTAVENCIVKVGKTLVFPNEDGRADTRVFYPFAFSRAN